MIDRTWVRCDQIVTVKGNLVECSDGWAVRADIHVSTGKVFQYDFGLNMFPKDQKGKAGEILAVQIRNLMGEIWST